MSRRYFATAGGFCMVVISKPATDEASTVHSSRQSTTRSSSKSSRTSINTPASALLKKD